MKAEITGDGVITTNNQRDADFLKLTIAVNDFSKQRRKEGLYCPESISEQCTLTSFVMWLKDNNRLP